MSNFTTVSDVCKNYFIHYLFLDVSNFPVKRGWLKRLRRISRAVSTFITVLADRKSSCLKKQRVSQHASCNKKLVKANLRSDRNNSEPVDIDPAGIMCTKCF